MATPLRLLLLEDNPSDAELVRHALRRAGYDPIGDRVETEPDFRDRLRRDPEIILSDFTMPEFDSLRALEIVREEGLDIPFIIVSGTIGEERAVQVMRRGADDYIIKDRLGRLGQSVAQALERKHLRIGARRAERRLSAQHAATKVLAESPDVETALPQILDAIRGGMGWDRAAAWMVDARGEKLAAAAHFRPSAAAGRDGLPEAARQKGFARGEGWPGRVWASGEPAWVPAAVGDDGFFGGLEAAPGGAYVGPIPVGAEVVGVIGFLCGDGEPRDGQVLEMMTAIGRQIGQFFERKRVEGGLRLFRALIDKTTDAIEVIDPETGRFLDVNEAACAAHGYTRAEYLGLTLRDIDALAGADPSGAGRRHGSRTFESLHRRKDGTTFPVEINANSIRLDRDYSVVVVRDITERKLADETIRANEERYRTLVAATTAIVWHTPASGEFETEQPAWTAFTGQTFAELRGHGWLDALHPDDRAITARAWSAAVAQRSLYEVEHRLRRADGEYRRMAVRAVPVRDPGGGIREWVGVHTDIHEHRQAELDRQDLLAMLDLQIERMPLAYLLSGPDFRYTRWNPTAERTFGFSEAEVLGEHPFDILVPEEGRSAAGDLLRRLEAGDMSAHAVCGSATRDGRIITCQWYNTPLMDRAGRFVGLLSLVQDITEQRRIEDQFRQAQKMEAFGQLAGGVAHDFNNLLTVISGYSELLLASLRPEDPNRTPVREIFKAGEKATLLTRQLLAFSRKQVVQPRVLDLNGVVADAETMLGRLIGEDVKLETIPTADLWPVLADPGQLEQVITNLVVNARDAMPTGGRIVIGTANVDPVADRGRFPAELEFRRHVALTVRDTGSGMSEEIQRHIFEPFFTTKEIGKGTGLGLATVFGIVRQSGGCVRVASAVGSGTTFEIYLPAADGALAANEAEARPEPVPSGRETILLVEDESGVRTLTRLALQDSGYTVIEARDGAEAIRISGRHGGAIALLVTDVVMPEMGGRELAERLAELRPHMRRLFVSGYTDDAVMRHGIRQSEVAFLQKPYGMDALTRKVRAVLDGPE